MKKINAAKEIVKTFLNLRMRQVNFFLLISFVHFRYTVTLITSQYIIIKIRTCFRTMTIYELSMYHFSSHSVIQISNNFTLIVSAFNN